MRERIRVAAMIAALAFTATAWAKIPPPPPPDEKAQAAAAEKKAKDAAAAEKAKADQAAAEERAVKNFQANLKKAGKPIPKPTPIVAATTPVQAVPGPGAAKGAPTPGAAGAGAPVSAKGHEKGAMTPAGNTPPKGTDTPADAKKK
jgi:membrane protein involved in colicin uptake